MDRRGIPTGWQAGASRICRVFVFLFGGKLVIDQIGDMDDAFFGGFLIGFF